MKKLHLVNISSLSILEQLQLEETLMRESTDDFCLYNVGSLPAIVMGISGEATELIDFEMHEKNPLPLIRRFSGGGTVVVDENTHFITWILNKESVSIEPFPKNLLYWIGEQIQEIIPHSSIAENDFVYGAKKFGGNAQYFTKNRMLHHTSLLWDYNENLMHLLLMPKKTPPYRRGRTHGEFLCTLKELLSSDEIFMRLHEALEKRFSLSLLTYQDLLHYKDKKTRITTKLEQGPPIRV